MNQPREAGQPALASWRGPVAPLPSGEIRVAAQPSSVKFRVLAR
jgi:hypothetical protein